MHHLLQKYRDLKAELKALAKELKDTLLEDPQYSEFTEDHKASGEVLKSYRTKLVADSVSLTALSVKRLQKKGEIGVVKQAIKDGVMVVEKSSGEQLSFNFNI